MSLERARAIFDVDADMLRKFEEVDAFSGNVLHGAICRLPDHRYGALMIWQVNDEPCEQVVYGTPKLHYPFDKQGTFKWPDVQTVEMWEKLDGTNVLAYRYVYTEKEFITFKTRLTPIVKDSGHGAFKAMWREYVEDNEWVSNTILANPDYNLSFELYGSRNPVTVKYDVPLAVALLFGVRRTDHAVRPPTQLTLPEDAVLPGRFEWGGDTDTLTEFYQQHRQSMTADIDTANSLVVEGRVMYAHTGEPSWRMFKCKAEQIEQLHWTAAEGIPKNAIWTTTINAYENYDDPTLDEVIELLKEEFSQQLIDQSMARIQSVYPKAKEHMKMAAAINKVWAKARSAGFDVSKDKAATFRWMSQYFPKNQMRRVGSVVLQQAGLMP